MGNKGSQMSRQNRNVVPCRMCGRGVKALQRPNTVGGTPTVYCARCERMRSMKREKLSTR